MTSAPDDKLRDHAVHAVRLQREGDRPADVLRRSRQPVSVTAPSVQATLMASTERLLSTTNFPLMTATMRASAMESPMSRALERTTRPDWASSWRMLSGVSFQSSAFAATASLVSPAASRASPARCSARWVMVGCWARW